MNALNIARPLVDAACSRPHSCDGCEARQVGLCAPLGSDALADFAAAGEEGERVGHKL